MSFFQYEDKLVRVTDNDGNTFTGVAEYLPAEYVMHEYGVDEDSIRIGEYVLYGSIVKKVEYLPTYEEAKETILPGKYRHFKGKEYEVLYIARHSETTEPMVVYKALYGDGGVWVRPADMWNETVERGSETFKRFTRIEDE